MILSFLKSKINNYKMDKIHVKLRFTLKYQAIKILYHY